MNNEIKYTSIERVISKFYRDHKGTEVSETDLIEWIGEALEFLRVPQLQEQAIAFLKVKDHHSLIPCGFHMVLQLAKQNPSCYQEEKPIKEICPKDVIDELEKGAVNELEKDILDFPELSNESKIQNDKLITDCCGNVISDVHYPAFFFDFQYPYPYWTQSSYYKTCWTPIRLADSTFFNTLVCKEKSRNINYSKEDRYTIVGNIEKKFRFSFKNGFVALSYLRNQLDPETGYPLVPDEISCITAITYYLKWKLSEWLVWNGRGDLRNEVQNAEIHWLKYARQSKNYNKMPKSLDDYQDLLEQTHYLIPRHKKYYHFFGKLV